MYEQPKRYILYNYDDPDLKPVCLRTPEPPEYKYIDGYGLPSLEQKFQYAKVPEKLISLEERAKENIRAWADAGVNRRVNEYRVSNEFWKLLDKDQALYQDEIRYIEKVHFHLHYGYWCFIKGVPTWLPPTYYRYLNFWYYPDVPGNRPYYRDADRRAYIYKWYCRTTNETLGNLDEKGYAQKDKDGNYTILKKSYRTVYGHAKVKRRREGATNQECSDKVWKSERTKNAVCPVMAETGDGATYIYETYLREGWIHQPLFLKPVNDVYPNSKEVKLSPPRSEYGVKSIGSRMFAVETAEEGGLDKTKTHNILVDEGAKAKGADVYRRHGVTKPTAAQHLDIHGYMAYPTTVEEMEEGGGAYKELWDSSEFYRRPIDGQTITGLLRIFQPAYDGLDGYIDAWGDSVIESPTEEQIRYAPPKSAFLDGIGAKQALEATYNALLRDGSPKAMKDYRESIRKKPLKVAHCWIGTAGDLGWNTVALDEREAILTRDRRSTERFELEWFNKQIDHPRGVVAVRNPNGRFEISDLLHGRNNKWTYTRGYTIWNEKKGIYERGRMPEDPLLCTAGADPFDYGNKPGLNHSMKSSGGFYVMLNFDENIDGERPEYDWLTETTICTYCYNPPSLEEYFEDVLKGCLFFQSMLVIERNKTQIWEHFVDRGYGGYLVYMRTPDGKLSQKPGLFTGQGLGSKDEYFNAAGDYIDKHIHRERHLELIKQMKEIQRPDQLRHYDLLTAFMLAQVGKRYGHQRTIKRLHTNTTLNLKGTLFDPSRNRRF